MEKGLYRRLDISSDGQAELLMLMLPDASGKPTKRPIHVRGDRIKEFSQNKKGLKVENVIGRIGLRFKEPWRKCEKRHKKAQREILFSIVVRP